MTIRPATADDIPQISRMMAASWKAGYRGILPDAYLETLSDDRWVGLIDALPEVEVLVLLDGFEVIGAASLSPAREAAFAGWGELVSLYILPRYFDRGTGVPLLEAVETALLVRGFREAYLWVLADNHRARHFYERQGWHLQGDRLTEEIGGISFTCLRYVRTL